METAEMGRVLVEAKVENLQDLWDVKRGLLTPDKVRTITIPEALVDSGATGLSLPTSTIQKLGLRKQYTKNFRSATGVGSASVYDTVQLTVQGRDCRVDVMEVPDGTPALIGQIPLEWLDFVIDMKNHKLIGDPRHGGEQIYEMY
jgi:predicted aspartyl protease